ncbi:hypothetical protein [Psychrobacter sp. I-STPA6b]|uniref:hypothetical protein n=1 Tax=Psychrobacter sp. I-STPA6b TaxID=2585718 RepID=UPI001D0C814B|nr:hypothetical protein [Psychrobacter sp. I-STPA6b]
MNNFNQHQSVTTYNEPRKQIEHANYNKKMQEILQISQKIRQMHHEYIEMQLKLLEEHKDSIEDEI